MSVSVQFGAATLSQLRSALAKSEGKGVRIKVENSGGQGMCTYPPPEKTSEYLLTEIRADGSNDAPSRVIAFCVLDDRNDYRRLYHLAEHQDGDYHIPTIDLVG